MLDRRYNREIPELSAESLYCAAVGTAHGHRLCFIPLPHPNPFFFLACEVLGLWVSCIMWPQAYLATLSGHTMSQHIARKSKGRRVSAVLSSPKPLRLGIPSPHVRDNMCWWSVCPNHLAVPRNQTDPHTGFVKCYMNYNSDRKKKSNQDGDKSGAFCSIQNTQQWRPKLPLASSSTTSTPRPWLEAVPWILAILLGRQRWWEVWRVGRWRLRASCTA